MSCSHNKEQVRQCPCLDNKIKQTLKIKITRPDGKEKVTVYSKINKEEETATLEGIGPLGRHIFTLNIKGNRYELSDRINKKDYSGNIEEFDVIPLNKDLIFSRLDINEPQPIVVIDEKKGVKVEINVIKQEPVE